MAAGVGERGRAGSRDLARCRVRGGGVGGSSSGSSLPGPVEKRTMEKTWKVMDQVVKLCQQPRLELKNSPPFILDILPDTYQHLRLIYAKEEPDLLRDNLYFRLFLDNLAVKCKADDPTLQGGARTGCTIPTDTGRRQLIKLSLTFSHILAELKSQFPAGTFPRLQISASPRRTPRTSGASASPIGTSIHCPAFKRFLACLRVVALNLDII